MNKQEAIRKLREEAYQVKPDQEFEVRRMEPEDAWGVVRCNFAVYGEHYPIDTNYIPERLIEENRLRNLYTVVARTGNGDIIGCGALYRSSAYSPRVYEYGQAIVHPEYRHTFAVLCIQDYILNVLVSQEDIDEVFGEAVCNHLVTQKLAALADFRETGLEVGVMSAEAYPSEDFPGERVSTVLHFRSVRDRMQEVYVPRQYEQVLEYIFSGLEISRSVLPSEARAPSGSATGIKTQIFDFAQVARFNVYSLGEDFPAVLAAEEEKARSRGTEVMQMFINLGEACAGRAVDYLRDKGYFFGGFLPRWFDTDGLFMQKLVKLPNFGSIKLDSERAHKILGLIRRDIEGNPACRALLSRSCWR
ncbi:MAG TPA: hypothetical protein PLM79_06300 [Syntrophobacteraceae bacterium]|nr:hypothetical protein [Syntrophobacteraceae bacterium]